MEMNVKLHIREVKEEARKLTIEEWAVYLLSKNGRSIYQHDAQDIVKLWGLIEFENGLIGFRTETIRDATPEEYRAWTYLQLVMHCACPERKKSSLDCNECFLSGACIASDFKTKIAIYILKGKEVILELV